MNWKYIFICSSEKRIIEKLLCNNEGRPDIIRAYLRPPRLLHPLTPPPPPGLRQRSPRSTIRKLTQGINIDISYVNVLYLCGVTPRGAWDGVIFWGVNARVGTSLYDPKCWKDEGVPRGVGVGVGGWWGWGAPWVAARCRVAYSHVQYGPSLVDMFTVADLYYCLAYRCKLISVECDRARALLNDDHHCLTCAQPGPGSRHSPRTLPGRRRAMAGELGHNSGLNTPWNNAPILDR